MGGGFLVPIIAMCVGLVSAHSPRLRAFDKQLQVATKQVEAPADRQLEQLCAELQVGVAPEEIFTSAQRALSGAELSVYREFLGRIWPLVTYTGTSHSRVLGQLAEILTADRDQQDFMRQTLAGINLTIRLLLSLPYLVLVGGIVFGLDLLPILLSNPIAWLSILLGMMLTLIARTWMRHLLEGIRADNDGGVRSHGSSHNRRRERS